MNKDRERDRQTDGQIDKERETDRQSVRQRDRDRDRQTDRQRQRDRERHRHTDRHTDREIETDRDRDREISLFSQLVFFEPVQATECYVRTKRKGRPYLTLHCHHQNATLVPSANKTAPEMSSGVKHTHHRFTSIVKRHLMTTRANTGVSETSLIKKYMRMTPALRWAVMRATLH